VTLAGGELRGRGLDLQSFLVVQELDQQEPLHIALPMAQAKLTAEEFTVWKRGLMIELARLCRELHRRHHYHKDLYYCHFYVHIADIETVPANWTNRATMIDFHRLQKHRFARPWHLIKDLAQLLYSSNVPGMTDAERQLFWQEYSNGNWGGTTPPAQWLVPWIRWKAGRYQAHHDRKQARRGKLQAAAP
jgi:heptose I phosphotransferase